MIKRIMLAIALGILATAVLTALSFAADWYGHIVGKRTILAKLTSTKFRAAG